MALTGILNVNKPAGLTSRMAVDRVERLVRPSKAGHAGTLDPLAAGVLVICVGQATRLIRFVQQMPKRYRAAFLLGRSSETDDLEGEVIELEHAAEPTRSMVDEILPTFVGEIRQRPPDHSAIKIAGRRAYKMARKGKPLDLQARPVTIHQIIVTRYEYPELELEIECGSGTYIRALGRDLGAALGTAAVMSALERTAIGEFTIEQSVHLEKLDAESLSQHLQPALAALPNLPRIELSDAEIAEIQNGRSISTTTRQAHISPMSNSSEWAAVDATGQLIGILFEKRPGQLWPAMNLK